jgi:Flp pilus assembly protein TadD
MNAMVEAVEGVLAPSVSQNERDALLGVGQMLYERGEFDKAADVLRFLVVAVPLDARAWWALGSCNEQLDDLEGAAAMYAQAVRLGEEDPQPALLCARALIRLDQREAAREVLEEINENELCSTNRKRWDALHAQLGEKR